MKTTLLSIIIGLVICSIQVNGQEAKKITYKVETKEYKIEYNKITNLSDLDKYKKKDMPLFLVDSLNIEQIEIAVDVLEQLDIQRTHLKNDKEITRQLEAEYQNVIKAQENRVIIYKDSYEQMRTINEDLSKQIDIAIEVGKKTAKRSKVNGVLFGVLGGLVTGMTVGVIVSN